MDMLEETQREYDQWSDACVAADVFASLQSLGTCPSLRLKAQPGPVRTAILQRLETWLPKIKFRKLPLGVSEDRLLGGLDLSATLSSGRTVVEQGVLAQASGGVLVVPSAQDLEASTIAHLCAVIDERAVRLERDGMSRVYAAEFGLVVFDESGENDAPMSASLLDRIDLHIDLTTVSIRAVEHEHERSQLPHNMAHVNDEEQEALCALATGFGLTSLRPTMQAIKIARTHAALEGRETVAQEDVVVAVRLSLLQRATQIPQPNAEEEAVEEQPEEQALDEQPPSNSADNEAPDDQLEEDQDQETENERSDLPPEEMMIQALAASLPEGLLAQMKAAQAKAQANKARGRSGEMAQAATRGRPLASRRGALRGGARLDLLATLRAAAPWQKVRANHVQHPKDGLHIRPGDFHIKRFRRKSASTAIFVVDASGSTALNRLAETKGAIEILLAESYARRDHVGMVSVRGREADVSLSPTRSLVRAKRSLSALPGGGGTPLASGLQSALFLAEEEKRQGRTPSIIVMTDGSANVRLDGSGGRPQAMEEAEQAALSLQAAGIRSMLLDVGRVPSKRAERLADCMGAAYLPMPFASSKTVSDAVRAQAG